MIDSRNISELNPIMKVLIEAFLHQAQMANIPVVITSTYRDAECQNKYFYSKPPVTQVRGNYSYHQWRVACDIVPQDDKGNPTWSPRDKSLWNKLGSIGTALGLEWGGSWSGFVDLPHYQCTFGYTCNDFIRGIPVPTDIKKGCAEKRIVTIIQNKLNAHGNSLSADGEFGNLTEKAVKSFQEKNQLPPTGRVDANTLKILLS